MEDGSIVARMAGTPQGGVISPLLANLFLHYAFDTWMVREFPQIPFERYADDAICHCNSAEEARTLMSALGERLAACKLVLHPQKTKIVYCKDGNKRRNYPNEKFDFLGYGFQPRRVKSRAGTFFVGFTPAISDRAGKAIRDEIRSWTLHLSSDQAIEDLSR